MSEKKVNKYDSHQGERQTCKKKLSCYFQETPTPPAPVAEVTTTARKRQKNKDNQTSPSPASSATRTTSQHEGILANRDEKSPTTTHAPTIPHPKLAVSIPKDEVEMAKQHQQQKAASASNKQAAPPAKKVVTTSAAVNRGTQPQQQEQPFTTVVNNRNKAGTPPLQQQQPQPQQQNKPVSTPAAAPPAAFVPVQQPAPVQAQAQAQQEPLPQRQTPQPQRDRPVQVNGFNTNTSTAQQQPPATATPPMKIADMIKSNYSLFIYTSIDEIFSLALPSSQMVVSELVSVLDAYPLSVEELNVVMYKIANRQAIIKQDWSKVGIKEPVSAVTYRLSLSLSSFSASAWSKS